MPPSSRSSPRPAPAPRRSRSTASRHDVEDDSSHTPPLIVRGAGVARDVSRSGQKQIRVPFVVWPARLPLSPCPTAARSPPRGLFPAGSTSRQNDIVCVAGGRSTATSRRRAARLTTDEPTPCRTSVGVLQPRDLAPRLKRGPDHLDAGRPGLRLPVGRDWATVSSTSADPSACSVTWSACGAASAFVDRVVDDLPQAVHEPAGVGRADVRAGASGPPQPLKDKKVLGIVGCLDDTPPDVVVRARSTCPAHRSRMPRRSWRGRHRPVRSTSGGLTPNPDAPDGKLARGLGGGHTGEDHPVTRPRPSRCEHRHPVSRRGGRSPGTTAVFRLLTWVDPPNRTDTVAKAGGVQEYDKGAAVDYCITRPPDRQ